MNCDATVNSLKHHNPSEQSDVSNNSSQASKHVISESRASNSSDHEADAELERLAGDSASDDDNESPETPADVAFARTKKQQQAVLDIIQDVKESGSTSLDLSQKHLQAFPDELLELTNLEFIYLEGNEIGYLPDEFFKYFPRLRWLDLRNNEISRIPSVYLSNHTCLRNLLLEGNNLRNLPLELGLVRSLHGLNIANNPLDFPPQEIIEKGTYGILSFLRDMMDAKNTAKMTDLDLNLSEDVPDGLEHVSASSDDWNTNASMMELAKRREIVKKSKSHGSSPYNGMHVHVEQPEYSIGARSAELHRPTSYTENRNQHILRLKKAGALGQIDRKKRKKESKLSWRVNQYPAPPAEDYVAFRMNEEKQLARVREFKEKTDAILQRRKDGAMLKNWRDDAKVLQNKKYSQRMVPGQDYEEPAEQAPYSVDKEMMKVLNKEERLKADLQKEKDLKEQRSMQARIRELEKRIKEHTAGMVERRKQPKGTPQHEMEIARRELDIVKKLQRDLMRRYQELKAWSAVAETLDINIANISVKLEYFLQQAALKVPGLA
ncbi:leucine-rich repeat-containing protein 27-like isoform x2 [Plakobranchus ocellatus]|uniref:Leucine-rich repeat-containing protein 27-like isoform x2 n=1 Tax=Plakobranchus ocellatus TaxID=259542 RepID=A0AAV4AQF8_9GAST|nr:leucine-rich repeat-containing protein 27-like isoform x2 [Plakobranchus ocellatus]